MSIMGYVTTLTGAEDASSLSLDFEKQNYRVMEGGKLVSKQFSEFFSFTRSTSGGRYNEKGLYESVPAGQPRFDHDPVTGEPLGLLIEESRTNLQIYGSQIAINYNPNSAIGTPLVAVAPDGTMSALRASSVGPARYNFSRETFVSNVPHAQSIHVKIESGSGVLDVYFGNGNSAGGVSRAFTVASDGTVTTAASDCFVVPAGGGWFRIGALYTPSGAVMANFTVTTSATMTILYWGRQIEVGAFPTSYIPTEASQVTRTVDVCSVNTLSPWYNASEGSIVVDFEKSVGSNAQAFAIAGNISNYLGGSAATITSIRGFSRVAGVTEAEVTVEGFPLGAKYVFAYKRNDVAISAAGLVPVVDKICELPAGMNRLLIGQTVFASSAAMHIRFIRYFPRRLTDSELQAITA